MDINKIDKEPIFRKHILETGINLFLGAGFSYNAYNAEGNKLPLGDDLKKLLIDEFMLQEYESFNLSQISNIIKSTQRGDFHRFIHSQYKVYDFNDKYTFLDDINIKNIFTINIDNLVERIFEQHNIKNFLYDVSICGTIDNDGIDFHKLHGSVTYPNENDLLFTPEELSILFTKETAKFHAIALKIASKPTLFWGTKMEDANVLSLLSKETIRGIQPQEKWIVITPENAQDITAEYFRSMRFNVIRAYTIDLLDYFNSVTSTYGINAKIIKTKQNKYDLLSSYFSSNYINAIIKKKHPVRPIKSFFSGDDPVWSDVIENKIIRLTAYNDCISRVFKNNIVFITGGIGSGKSTLLMQLSVDNDIEGLKFFFNGITKTKAVKLHKILKHEEGPKVLFLDNISNNLDAFLFLKETEDYTIVCADRDINYDMVKHIAKFKNEEIVDITELSDIDIQAICDLAHNTTFYKYKGKMSLFEISYYVWQGKKLSSKINNLITTLSNNKKHKKLLEFFTLMTYVRSCGISASMDMLLLYYTNDEIDYQTIYSYVNKLKSMIDDEDHFTIGDEQDFFTLRSKLFAELSLKRIPSNVLAKVMKKFATNVHRDCIVRYDIFKRNGYDADIAKLAFKEIEDGKDYYETIIEMDNSEYRYQQYALYLFRNNQFKEAWNKIDIAHSINPRNLAIKNTHAYILFKNNINIEEDIETVIDTLEYTFDVISSCISRDLRKTFHVITFSENALSFYHRFVGSEFANKSTKYIDDAHMYINEEMNKDDFISRRNWRKLKWLINEIEDIKK